jgi:hypothetical protein
MSPRHEGPAARAIEARRPARSPGAGGMLQPPAARAIDAAGILH